MATPSWLPTWPTGWPDIEARYKALVGSMVPRGLFDPDGENAADWAAIGEALGQVRKLIEWVLGNSLPHRDSEGMFLWRWEELLQLVARGATATRQAWIVARLRQRGTETLSLAKAVMAGAWGEIDGSFLSVYHQDPAVYYAERGGYTTDAAYDIREQQYLHFYPTAEDVAPDWDIAADLIARFAPTWAYWTVGRYKVMEYDGGADSGWDRGHWSN